MRSADTRGRLETRQVLAESFQTPSVPVLQHSKQPRLPVFGGFHKCSANICDSALCLVLGKLHSGKKSIEAFSKRRTTSTNK